MNRWPDIARDMIAKGEKQRAVAALLGVSEARISQILREPRPRPVQVPAWVAPANRRSYRILALERGTAIAIAWAKKVQGS